MQFAKPDVPTKLLEQLNTLAVLHGRQLEIRFYGHYSDVFDVSVLRHLPNAQCLSVDCLIKASSLESLAHLPHLKELRLGVYELAEPDVLAP